MNTELEINGRKIDLSSYKTMIEGSLAQLEAYRDDGRIPSPQLLWEIDLYKWILKCPDAEKASEDYFKTRERLNREHQTLVDKELVVKELGWEIS